MCTIVHPPEASLVLVVTVLPLAEKFKTPLTEAEESELISGWHAAQEAAATEARPVRPEGGEMWARSFDNSYDEPDDESDDDVVATAEHVMNRFFDDS